MATFAIKCPHCLRDNTSFTVVASRPIQPSPWPSGFRGLARVEVFGTCNACLRGVCGAVAVNTTAGVTHKIEDIGSAIDLLGGITIEGWLPKPEGVDLPGHLPPVVERAYAEAERLKLAGFRGPAGNAYRRALEAALKEVEPDLKGSLYGRIEALANTGRLTANMKDFAHRIRTLGNEASHETPVVEDDEIDDLAIFTKLFLMYEFTLPGMLPKKDSDG
jgi:hypothetical protein